MGTVVVVVVEVVVDVVVAGGSEVRATAVVEGDADVVVSEEAAAVHDAAIRTKTTSKRDFSITPGYSGWAGS
ncbi:MAG: hypothetical protein GY926_07330 [bacterium]|nr:hypothetical protein [bacterium]